MYEFSIPDMTCGHCASAVSKAIKAIDPNAVAEVDLTTHKARVETTFDPGVIGAAIEEAGYPSTFARL